MEKKTDIDMDKLNEIEAKALAEKLKKKYGINATPGRKRPRNPRERETLLRWREERGGGDIGEI